MKKSILALMAFCAVAAASCGKEEKTVIVTETRGPMVETTGVSDVAFTIATLEGRLNVSDELVPDIREFGFEYSTDSEMSDVQTVKSESMDIEMKFRVPLKKLSENTQYYYRAYLKHTNGYIIYGNIKSFTTKTHEYVDLGLSVKWATFNVGAERPEDCGYYFAWGETQSKSDYSWSTYKYCNGSETTMTKYCHISTSGADGFTDSKLVLDLDDDVAHANWGGDWRMPTDAEWAALCQSDNCTWTWTTLNGVNGYKVQSNKSGFTDKWIFLPAAGYRYDTDLSGVGSCGYYWSNLLHFDLRTAQTAWLLGFYSDRYSAAFTTTRFAGLSVRPVRP